MFVCSIIGWSLSIIPPFFRVGQHKKSAPPYDVAGQVVFLFCLLSAYVIRRARRAINMGDVIKALCVLVLCVFRVGGGGVQLQFGYCFVFWLRVFVILCLVFNVCVMQ